MRLTISLKLLPTPEQAESLRLTMTRFNAACNAISERAFTLKTASHVRLHRECYYRIRAEFRLSAQMAVRAIGKVSEVYKRDKTRQHQFRPDGAMTLDNRLLSYKRLDHISILTLQGRQTMAFVCGPYHQARLSRIKGEADLIERDEKFFLLQTVELPEPPPIETTEFLGVDLGIVNLATTSDGETLSGKTVKSLRHRHHRLRKKLQAKGTKSAKRLLKKRRRKETSFQRDVNHCLSKRLVTTAQRTGRGIALEELTGIRSRIRASRPQRRVQHGWAFRQLREFLVYKARLAGVPIVLVDPRNTSRTCPACGHCEKANRPTQSRFSCVSCRFSGDADHIAAVNIGRAAVNRPDVDAPPRSESQTPSLAAG